MAFKLNVIVGSTRPGRVGLSVARWFAEAAGKHGGFAVEFVDIAEFSLPVLDEPHHPRMQKYQNEHTRRWAAAIKQADAFVFVTPEYNFGTSPALLNALDFLVLEWGYAPAGVVSYGGVSGGLRAAEHLKPTLAALNMMPVPQGVPIPMVQKQLDEQKTFQSNELIDASVKTMLDALATWAGALAPLRAERRG